MLPASTTLVVLALCDPPLSSDIREGMEAARAHGCARVAFLPLGSERPGQPASPLARHVLCQLALQHCAPAALALGAAATPALLAPHPATAEATTAGALQHLATLLPPGAPATLCLSRGVAEWLAGAQAAPGTLAAWRAALPALAQGTGQALVLGPLLATPEANLQRQAALAAQLGCPVACLGHSPSSSSSSSGAGAGLACAFGTEGLQAAAAAALLPPPVRSFLARQGLVGAGQAGDGGAWWRAPRTLPDAWLDCSSGLPATLAPARSLEPSPTAAAAATAATATAAAPPCRRVACLGGSFNPPTQAHLLLAAQVLDSGAADEVWLVPCGARQDKAGVALPCTARTILTALAVEAAFPCTPRVRTMPLELREAAGALASADLFARLEEAASGGAVFYLALGMDCMGNLAAWRHPARLLANVRFLVCPRPGYEGGGERGSSSSSSSSRAWPVHATVLGSMASMSLSSSEVRVRIGSARSAAGAVGGGAGVQAAVAAALDGLVHAPVAALIANVGLYS